MPSGIKTLTKEDIEFIYKWRAYQPVTYLAQALEVNRNLIYNHNKTKNLVGPKLKNTIPFYFDISEIEFIKEWIPYQPVRCVAFALDVPYWKVRNYLIKEGV